MTFFESVPYFSAKGTSLKGEQDVGSLLLPIPLLVSIPASQFDGGNRNPELLVHTQRKKPES